MTFKNIVIKINCSIANERVFLRSVYNSVNNCNVFFRYNIRDIIGWGYMQTTVFNLQKSVQCLFINQYGYDIVHYAKSTSYTRLLGYSVGLQVACVAAGRQNLCYLRIQCFAAYCSVCSCVRACICWCVGVCVFTFIFFYECVCVFMYVVVCLPACFSVSRIAFTCN